MDPRFLDYYNKELRHLRDSGGEFAKEFPKIAARLGLDSFECADPYVERLLEGFAFMAARVQLKIDDEFPRFTQHLFEMVYPHYLAPTPSMAIVRFEPDLTEGSLADGFVVPRGSVLRTPLAKGDTTACEYRTAHDATLWPMQLTEAAYFSGGDGRVRGAKAGIKFRLSATAGLTFDKTSLDKIVFHLRGGSETALQVYERLFADSIGILASPANSEKGQSVFLETSNISRCGFGDEEALLPHGPRSFHGYRLLQEYFAFPDRFMFVEINGLKKAVKNCADDKIDITVFFDRSDPFLERAVDASLFSLFCTPAINLFPRRADRIHLSDKEFEYHLVPDRTRPADFEAYQVTGVVGHGTSADQRQEFLPFYSFRDRPGGRDRRAYYTIRRAPRVTPSRQGRLGARSSYVGSETFISIVDADEAPFSSNMKQLAVETLCTNRDLPLFLSVGQGRTDFTLQASAPASSIRCVSGPTKPMPSRIGGEAAWRLISHLSLNYLSLTDDDKNQGASALRELLNLYGGTNDANLRKQVEGVRSVTTAPINRRLPVHGPVTYGRGLEITVTFDESYFGGKGAFLLGSVLEQFFAKYVSINSFTETVINTVERGEIIRWRPRKGTRPAL